MEISAGFIKRLIPTSRIDREDAMYNIWYYSLVICYSLLLKMAPGNTVVDLPIKDGDFQVAISRELVVPKNEGLAIGGHIPQFFLASKMAFRKVQYLNFRHQKMGRWSSLISEAHRHHTVLQGWGGKS